MNIDIFSDIHEVLIIACMVILLGIMWSYTKDCINDCEEIEGVIKMFDKCVPNHPEYLTDEEIDSLSKRDLRSSLKRARDILKKNTDTINDLYNQQTTDRLKIYDLTTELKPYREAKNRSDFEAAGFSESQTEFLMNYIKENR